MDFSEVNIGFFGSSDFSVESLKVIHTNNFNIKFNGNLNFDFNFNQGGLDSSFRSNERALFLPFGTHKGSVS